MRAASLILFLPQVYEIYKHKKMFSSGPGILKEKREREGGTAANGGPRPAHSITS
jgi:hypothetical protein